MTQTVPFAALSNAPLLSGADLDTLTSGIPSPPTYELPPSSLSFQSGMSEFGDQYLATLNTSRTIGDYHKAVAELFSRNAALQVAELAVEEMEARGTSAEQAAFVLMAAMGAARDAAVAAVTLKLQYETARPSSVLQCAFGNRRLFAWKGAYRGVGRFEQGQLWRSYLTNPPFPGYVSGHSGIAVAGARVLAAAFGGDVAGVNCRRRMQGESMVEPRVERGAFGYVEGVTDVPNKGADTVGYSPARNVTVCWRDWNGFSDLVVRSRLLAGIHVPTDNFHGEKVGEAAAEKMLQLARGLCVGDSCLLK